MLTYGAHKPNANNFSSLNIPRVQSRKGFEVEIETRADMPHDVTAL